MLHKFENGLHKFDDGTVIGFKLARGTPINENGKEKEVAKVLMEVNGKSLDSTVIVLDSIGFELSNLPASDIDKVRDAELKLICRNNYQDYFELYNEEE